MCENNDSYHEILKKAIEEDKNENYKESLELYKEGIKLMINDLKINSTMYNDNQKNAIKEKCKQFLSRAEKLSEHFKHSEQSDSSEVSSDKNEDLTNIRERFVKVSNIGFDQVIGMDDAKKFFTEKVILPFKHPEIFKTWPGRYNHILLFGLPGVGKTFLVNAITKELANVTFMSAHSSDLMSRYMFENEKMIVNIFKLAKQTQPCILFIDEIDVLDYDDSDSERETSRRVKTELLIQIALLEQSNDQVMLIAATNAPWKVGPSTIRRFNSFYCIKPPGRDDRTKLLKNTLTINNGSPNFEDEFFNEISQMTDGYTISDLLIVARDALMNPVRQIANATHFKQIITENGEIKMKACEATDDGAIKTSVQQLNCENVYIEPITKDDVLKAIQNYRINYIALLELESKFIQDYCNC